MGLFSKKKDDVNEKVILSPIKGQVAELKHLSDGVFSEGMLGKGMVVEVPVNEKKVTFYAPMSGELVAAFPTGHAYGIKSGDIEVLLHIGVDTVNLDGKGFKSHVKQGNKVRAGEPLVDVDVEFVRKNAPSTDAIVIVTSGQDIHNKAPKGDIETGNQLFEVK